MAESPNECVGVNVEMDECAYGGMNGCDGVNLRLLQLNCQHSYAVMADISERVAEGGIQVCLFQEPYAYAGRVCGLPAGTRVFVSESEGACVAVPDRAYECMLVEECKFMDGVCVWIKGAVGEMFVVSLYCRPNGRMSECMEYLNGVLGVANGKRVFVGMDANATSDLWFSKPSGRGGRTVGRGRVLEEWIVRKGMNVLNEPARAYTFSGARGESDIDVTLLKGSGYRCEWKLKDDWSVSDHNPILIVISVGQDECGMRDSRMKRWNARKCEWNKYRCLIESSASDFGYERYLGLSAGEKVGLMYDWIVSANDECMKRVSGKSARKAGRVAWWNDQLRQKRAEVMRRRRRYQAERRRTGDPERVKWNEWKECMHEYKKCMKDAKESDWHRFVGKESARDPWGKVYKICMGKLNERSLTGLRTQNGWTRTWNESANVLLNEFFPPDDGVPLLEGADIAGDGMYEFSMNEVESAVEKMSTGKAPGMDGVTNEMIRNVWFSVPLYLKGMYDSCLNEGLFPNQWKEARVVTLLKGAGKDRTEPRSYRPISLLSGLGKVLERMMTERMMIRMNGKWNDCQYGFVSGRCTEDAWERVKVMVAESRSKHVIGVFVDYKGAFDYLLWRVILAKLREVGCAPEDMRLWSEYFKDRWVCMMNGMDEVRKRAERGCPQGSIAGPNVWNLCMNECLDLLNALGVNVVAYADDLLLVVEGATRNECESAASEVMKVVCEWGERVGVQVSDTKTVCMVLKGGMNMINRRVHVEMNECVKKIRFVECVKYLGVNMGVNMNFRVHVNGMRERVNGLIGCLRRVMRKDWGLKKGAVSVIVKGLLAPAVLYAASVWYRLAQLKGVSAELNRCQRCVLYACTRVCRTVSTEAMQVIAGSLPWDIECVRRANLYKVRRGVSMNEMDLVTNEEINESSVPEMIELVNMRANEKWQRRWDECVNGRVLYEWIRDVRFSGSNLAFEPSLRVCYVLTGHGSLNDFLYMRSLSEAPCCVCGHEREDWVHLLCECEMYEAFRDLEGMNVVRKENEWDVSRVLRERESYERMCVFVERAYRMRASVIARMNNERE